MIERKEGKFYNGIDGIAYETYYDAKKATTVPAKEITSTGKLVEEKYWDESHDFGSYKTRLVEKVPVDFAKGIETRSNIDKANGQYAIFWNDAVIKRDLDECKAVAAKLRDEGYDVIARAHAWRKDACVLVWSKKTGCGNAVELLGAE